MVGLGATPDGSGGPHAIVSSIDGPELATSDRHHLERALRLRPGDPLTVTNGEGQWRACALTSVGLETAGDIITVAEPNPSLTVGFAVTKGTRPELAIQKLTELGVDSIVIFAAERSVARWDPDKSDKQYARFARIVHEAVMQSRRVWLPSVRLVDSFEALVTGGPGLVVRADMGAPALSAAHHTVLIGPAGRLVRDRTPISA